MKLPAGNAERIALLYRAAKRHGSLVSLHELSRLLEEALPESAVEDVIASSPILSSKLELRSGYLTERGSDSNSNLVLREADNRRTAQMNLRHASRFSSFLHTSGFEVIAVSGSTSYGSASASKDADLFCVAPRGMMWAALARGLLMARAYGVVRKGAPQFCLSCIMDESYALSTFKTQRHPLFARDAIEAKVLRGKAAYASLMRVASWVAAYYPLAYGTPAGESITQRKNPSAFAKVVNKLLFNLVGRYIRAKSSLLNRRLLSRGRSGDTFRVRCAEDHLIYESRRYLDLKREYEILEQPNLSSEV